MEQGERLGGPRRRAAASTLCSNRPCGFPCGWGLLQMHALWRFTGCFPRCGLSGRALRSTADSEYSALRYIAWPCRIDAPWRALNGDTAPLRLPPGYQWQECRPPVCGSAPEQAGDRICPVPAALSLICAPCQSFVMKYSANAEIAGSALVECTFCMFIICLDRHLDDAECAFCMPACGQLTRRPSKGRNPNQSNEGSERRFREPVRGSARGTGDVTRGGRKSGAFESHPRDCRLDRSRDVQPPLRQNG